MATEYLPVRCEIVGNPGRWEDVHTSLGRTFTDRQEAIDWGIAELDHDDFRIATLVDGKLAAIGWGIDDFGPDDGEDLLAIARQLSVEVAA